MEPEKLWYIRQRINLEIVGMQEEFHATGKGGMSNKIIEENLHIWRRSHPLSYKRQTEHQIDKAFISYI